MGAAEKQRREKSDRASLIPLEDRRRVCSYFDIVEDESGNSHMVSYVRGIALIRLVLMNKGTAFTAEERVELGLDGLLPSQVCTLEEQLTRAYNSFKRQPDPISKYQFLRGLQERQEILFYALINEHLEEMMPVIYTPTVGDAVANFSSLYENPRGLSVSPQNVARLDSLLDDYPLGDTRLIVATDSSAILGIGDQGYGGLAISIGKLSLYTVGGGISPFHSMPVCLDVGTDTQHLLDDPLYVGTRQPRMQGEAYIEFVDQFVAAVKKRWPKVILQWEDLSKEAAFKVLDRYRGELASFNDDIQGTGAVALAGVLSACRVKGEEISDQSFLVYGAGAGGIGVAWAIREGLIRSGLSHAEAMERIFVFDSRGLLLEDRELVEYKRPFARSVDAIAGWDLEGERPTVIETIRNAKVSALIGLSGQTGAFGAEWVQAVQSNTERPIIFALSNPTILSEGKPVDFLEWTDGAALVATGSPFDDVILDGRTHYAAQGNNAFIFPGLGAGAMLCEARSITDGMIMEAADALARYTGEVYPEGDRIYPELSHLSRVSQIVAAAVVRQAQKDEVARVRVEEDEIDAFVEARAWEPRYLPVRPANQD